METACGRCRGRAVRTEAVISENGTSDNSTFYDAGCVGLCDRRIIVHSDGQVAGSGNAVAILVGGDDQATELEGDIILIVASRMIKLGQQREGPAARVGIE